MSLNPTASFAGFTTASATEFVQSTTALDIQFTNPTPGATEAGYQPYVTVELPSGVTWGGTATYMGNAVRVTTVMLSGVGTAPYPFALSGGGTRPLITGAPNATVVVAELPFGSFTPGQTALDLSIPVTLASTAAPGIALAIKTTAGFAYGNSPLGANGVVQATPSTFRPSPSPRRLPPSPPSITDRRDRRPPGRPFRPPMAAPCRAPARASRCIPISPAVSPSMILLSLTRCPTAPCRPRCC